MFERITAYAPGSIMLLGEHAVLETGAAIVTAIDQCVAVELVPARETSDVCIESESFGRLMLPLSDLRIQAPFEFLLAAMLQFGPLPCGFKLVVKSQMQANLGLGTSAAVTAAACAALHRWVFGREATSAELFELAFSAVRQVQKVGSGADLAASIFGGTLHFQTTPFKVEALPQLPNISVVYCGYKTPTPEVVAQVKATRAREPARINTIFQAIHALVGQAVTAIQQQDWSLLGELFCYHQACQVQLGVSDTHLDELVEQLKSEATILGAKISGSGLGDCIIGLGTLARDTFPKAASQAQSGVRQLSLNVSNEGIIYA